MRQCSTTSRRGRQATTHVREADGQNRDYGDDYGGLLLSLEASRIKLRSSSAGFSQSPSAVGGGFFPVKCGNFRREELFHLRDQGHGPRTGQRRVRHIELHTQSCFASSDLFKDKQHQKFPNDERPSPVEGLHLWFLIDPGCPVAEACSELLQTTDGQSLRAPYAYAYAESAPPRWVFIAEPFPHSVCPHVSRLLHITIKKSLVLP